MLSKWVRPIGEAGTPDFGAHISEHLYWKANRGAAICQALSVLRLLDIA